MPNGFSHRLLTLFLCVIAVSSQAQSAVDATKPGPGVVYLLDGWRVHAGDNPAWASPGFNDSDWTVAALGSTQAMSGVSGWRWYRLHVRLPADHPPLALMIEGPVGTYQVYLDGHAERDGNTGADIKSIWHIYAGGERVFRLPTQAGEVEIAIRAYFPSPDAEIYGLSISGVLLGPEPAIEEQRLLARDQRLLPMFPAGAADLAQIVAGFGAILLFLLRRISREYLYLGLYFMLSGISGYTFYGVLHGCVTDGWNGMFGDPLGYPTLILQIEFTYAFMGRRVRWGWRTFEFVLLGGLVFGALLNMHLVTPAAYLLFEGAVNVPVAVMLPALLLIWYLRGNPEAGWLILPSLVPAISDVAADLGLVAGIAGWSRLEFLGRPIVVGPVAINGQDAASIVYLLGIGLVMALRFTRVSQEQARTAAELEAAREIQQRLVPVTLPAVPGYRMEAAYVPAQEVGGDFYQVLPQHDGSTLVLVGDVSGKGLKAAMNGMVAIGAARALGSEQLSPGMLLTRLNAELAGTLDGGFITCLCVHIAADGAAELANAGHLAPYRNGEEVEVDAGLPLGIAIGIVYAERTLKLAGGETLLLLSDGVVEARSAAGELFGFERTRAISCDSAEKVAQAAQAFGQEDDITVVRLQRAAEVVTHA